MVEKMVERGLVLRQGDNGERRRVRVWLTDEGRALAARMVGEARSNEGRVLALLGPGTKRG